MILHMKRIMLAALAAAACPIAAEAAERRYSITSFDRIQVDGPYQVTVQTGRSNSAVATGTARALDGVSIEVQSRVLKISPNRSAWGGKPGDQAGPVAIAVTAHELRAATVAGSGTINIDKAKAMKFDVTLSGSGRIGLDKVEADILSVGLLGSGKIALGGKAKTFKATVRGAGDLAGDKLAVEDAEINSDTAGTVSVGVRRAAKITSTGAGDTTIIGSPACTLSVRGAGRVFCSR